VHQPESVIPPNNRQAIIGCLFVLLGAFGFSAKAVLIKLAYDYSHQLDVITLMVLRMAISLPFFWWLRYGPSIIRQKRKMHNA